MNYPTRNRVFPASADFSNLFENFFRPSGWEEENVAADMIPRIDVVEREHEFAVHAELPGVKKEDVEITVENGVLTISGATRSQTEEKEGDRVVRQERRYGRYVRSLRLGKEIDEKSVKAAYKDGVLALTLPKSEAVKPRKIAVNVQ
jgi:HSP20 family protein